MLIWFLHTKKVLILYAASTYIYAMNSKCDWTVNCHVRRMILPCGMHTCVQYICQLDICQQWCAAGSCLAPSHEWHSLVLASARASIKADPHGRIKPRAGNRPEKVS